MTPTHYHLMQRLYRSRELLQYTNISVADVAARLGFLSVNDFSRAFKKNLGISPSLVKQQGYLATRKEEKMPERLIYFEKEDRKVEKCKTKVDLCCVMRCVFRLKYEQKNHSAAENDLKSGSYQPNTTQEVEP